jgi:DNA-binding NarL/FixJ family response regulator
MLKVAIVEDHPDVMEPLCAAIAAMPDMHLLAACEDLPSIKKVLEVQCPDILLVDLRLPGGDGLEAIGRAKYRWGNLCTSSVLTAHRYEKYLLEAVRAGAKGFIDKSHPPESWPQAVRDLAAGQSPLNTSLASIFRDELKRLPSPPAALLEPQFQDFLAAICSSHNYTDLQHSLGLDAAQAGRMARTLYDAFQTWHELTARELQCLHLLASDLSPQERAARMGVTPNTAKTHGANLSHRLGASDQQEAIRVARFQGIIP